MWYALGVWHSSWSLKSSEDPQFLKIDLQATLELLARATGAVSSETAKAKMDSIVFA